MLWISWFSPFVPFICFSFLNELILLYGNSVIYEVNKTESPISKLIFCRDVFLEFSVFTMTCSTMLLFLQLNKISLVIIFVVEWTLLLFKWWRKSLTIRGRDHSSSPLNMLFIYASFKKFWIVLLKLSTASWLYGWYFLPIYTWYFFYQTIFVKSTLTNYFPLSVWSIWGSPITKAWAM